MDSNKQKIMETLRTFKISAKDVERFELSVCETENNFRKKDKVSNTNLCSSTSSIHSIAE